MPDPRAGACERPCAVIDTNVWLDIFVFQDVAARPLARMLQSGAMLAIRSTRTQAELRAVLARPQFAAKLTVAAAAQLMQTWQAMTRNVEPTRVAPWLCRDPNDQKFLDLAFSARAALLLTKDRALLDLARKARRDGLHIAEPGILAALDGAPHAACSC